MDTQTIEFYKKQMMADSVLLFENQNLLPNDISISWDITDHGDFVVIEMTATHEDGSIITQKSQKVEQLNG